MSKLDYAAEKFHNALYSLVRSGPIEERLLGAFMSFHPIRAEDFGAAPDLRNGYLRITKSLTAVEGSPGEGSVNATVARMSDEDRERIAREIVELTLLIDAERRYRAGQ